MELSVQAFDRICRTCLTESSNMISLNTKLEDGNELVDLLIFTANIEAKNEDELPKQVCGDCEAFIHKAEKFKRRCIESEKILKNLCQKKCDQYFVNTDENIAKSELKIDFCSEKPSIYQENVLEKTDLMCLLSNPNISLKKLEVSKYVDEKPSVKKEEALEYDNNDFSNDFDDRDELLTIPIEYKQETQETLKCVCGEQYENKDNMKQHLKIRKCTKYKKYVKKHSSKTFIPIRNELACPKCDLTFNLVSSWNAHQASHDNETKSEAVIPQLQCSLCLRKFKTKKTLSRHIKRHEATDNVKHTCPKCKRDFKYKAFLKSHMLSVHFNASDGYVCDYCPEKFSTRKSLEVHNNNHKKKKNSCPFCDKSFLMVCTLKDHIRTHTGEKPFLCSICGKGFSQKTNLGQHMKRHMGLKTFRCDTCSMGFVSKGELDSHTRKHSGAHPFICDDCGNGFTTSSALVKHRRTHTGERPYACDLCPMKFAATSTLKNHRRTHTGERPYQCSHCEKSFVQRSDLISHIRCHTGERPFVCPQCGQAFRKAAAMKAHVKMHTRETQNVMTLDRGLILNSLQCDGHLGTV